MSMLRGILRKAGAIAVILFGIAGISAPAFADVSGFVGDWVNVDPATSGITRVVVTSTGGDNINVRVWGRCHPADCDWGTQPGRGYYDSVSSNHVHGVMAEFNAGFSNTTLILHQAGGGGLSFDALTQFTDGSARHNYDSDGRLRRAAAPPAGGGAGLSGEDCLPEPWQQLSVQFAGGAWKIVKGSEWVLDFRNNKAAAEQALAIIRNYRFDQICYVQRPNPSMTYWKRGGTVPGGAMPGQDCIALNPDTAHAAQVQGRWKIVDGSQWVLDFGTNMAAAQRAEQVIKTYHLGQQCFVARPNPPMAYWLAQ
jgi:hypothetical protein